MKKIINESGKTHLAVDIMFYFVYVFIGILMLKFPQIEELKPIEYAPIIFYMLGFFSLLSYFVNRRPKNYEFLFLGLINILVGTFITFFSSYEDTGFILGNAILIYSLFTILNKGYHTIMLAKEKNINMYAKASITIMLVLLGFLVLQNLFKATTMQTLVLGYYFLTFGIMSLVEVALVLLLRIDKLKNYFQDLIDEKPEDITLDKIKQIKPQKTKKINRK